MPLRFRISFTVFIGFFMLAMGVSPLCPGSLTPGKFYVVGTGPAGPEHATVRALEVIKGAEYILCDEDMKHRFPVQLQGKTILADPWMKPSGTKFKPKPWRELKPKEKQAIRAEVDKKIEEVLQLIKDKLAQGKTVALLDSGDPCLFSQSHWYIEGLDPQQVEIVPGVGAFSAAMAALKKSSLPAYDARFLMQTSPQFLTARKMEKGDKVVQDLGKYPHTMVFYMGMKDINNLINMLKKTHPGDLPIAVVYYAGYPDKEKVVKGTLDNILGKIASEKEEWLGITIVGRCLEGKPRRGMIDYYFGAN